MNKKTIELLQERALNVLKSNSPKGFFFSSNYIAEKYRELFEIGENTNFDKAFNIVAFGQGNEIVKMNSLQSSSLLSLLFFYPLFENSKNKLFIDNVVYNRCFFEIKNNVVKFPSCVDVVLCSEENKKLLFIESKFTEYIKLTNRETYGSTYYPLYKELKENGLLPKVFNILSEKESSSEKDSFIIQSDEKIYIEGIKQSISHIIGLIRGPYLPKKDKEDEYKYQQTYKKFYEDAEEVIYATILYNPKGHEEEKDFNNYVELYNNSIINNRDDIITHIKGWDFLKNKMEASGNKKITINNKILTYQGLSDSNKEYMELLPQKIRKFYNL